jgi:N-acetylneuraminic acid mutarotase
MSKFLFLLLLTLLWKHSTYAQDFWLQKDTVNGPPKAAASAFVIENRAYLVAGTDDFEYKRKMYSYRADQNDWDDEVSLGGDGGDGLARVGASSFSLQHEGQTKGYVTLGQTQTIAFMNDLWEYDRSTEAWTQKANFSGAPRREAVSFVIGNKAYVGTGNSATGLKKDFYTYDPSSNSWEQIADFAGSARRAAVGFSMNTYGFLGTGDDGTLRNDFWMYDPQIDQWIQKAHFPGNPRSGACGWAAFPVCYLGTGQDANYTYHNDLWEYNYFLNNWTQRADLPGPGRKNAVAFYLDGWGHIGTGYNNGTFYDDLWAYSGTAAIAEQQELEVMVSPNPTADFVTVSMNADEANVAILNHLGQKMAVVSEKSGSKLLIDVRHFPSGVYYLQINSAAAQQSTTFVKCNGTL